MAMQIIGMSNDHVASGDNFFRLYEKALSFRWGSLILRRLLDFSTDLGIGFPNLRCLGAGDPNSPTNVPNSI